MKKLNNFTNFWCNALVCFLLMSFGQLRAQVVVTSVTPKPASVDFADTNFQMDLEVGLTLPVGVTTAEVKVTFATGLEYVSVAPGTGTLSVVRKAGDTNNLAPTFTVTGTAGAPLVFTVKKKVTQAALASFTSAGVQFYDNVSATPAGPNSNRQSTAYKLNWPVLQITLDAGAVTEAVGTYTHSFTVKNTSEFKLKEIYFSVAYPAGIEKVSLTAPSGYTLTAVGTVPTGKGLPSEGKDLYKLTKAGSFAANETITLTEKYKIKVCGSNSKQVDYTPYWGPSATELYWKVGINTPASRTVNLKAVNTTTAQTGSQENYFEWKDGLCGAVVGTSYIGYKNTSADNSTAYKNKIRIITGGNYIPININIIAADNTKILLSPGDGTNNITLDLNDLAALSVTALAGKDVGLTDEDNDGFADDLKKDATLRICYDLKTKTGATTFTCANIATNFNSNDVITSFFEDACGQEKTGARYNPQNIGREFTFTDGSAQPAQLVKNQAIEGYLMLSYGYLSSYQKYKGQSWTNNEIRYRYYAKLPQGVKMTNIRYYYGQDPNDRTVPSVAIADVPAGGVLDYTALTTNYPAGTPNDIKDSRKPGYIAYELELSDCTGVGTTGNLEYRISILDKNGDGTFCEIPRVCVTKAISMGCPTTTCALKGPQMLSTKVERADDSYGWTDATMTQRVARTAVTASQRRRALYLDHIEVISEGQQSNAGPTDNLYYYMAVAKTAELEPKSIKVKVGSYETTLQASAVVSRTQDAQGKYFLWNLTSALPAGVLAASQTFSVVATYQVMNANIPNGSTYAKDIQSGQTSFFYSLDDKTNTNVNAQGFHTAQQHCGVDLIPVFNIIETYTKLASNQFNPEACNEYAIGGNIMYSTRTTLSTDNFTGEYRPGRRIKKITIKMPLSYRIIRDRVMYSYNAVPSDVSNNNRPSVPIPLSKWTMNEGTERVYTYTNPSNTADPYYLPPGMVTMKGAYAEYLQPIIQASCSTKEATSIFAPSDNTPQKKEEALKAAGQKASVEVEYEDYYYHYAQTTEPAPVVNKGFEQRIWYSNKPQLVINAEGQGLSFIANATEQEARFSLSVPPGKPNTFYAWVSIPDVPGMEVVSLQETNAAGVPQGTPFTPQTISGEKMFHVSQLITATKKYYTVKFKITSCNTSALKFKLYAGWNCSGYPTGGYRTTCATSSGTDAYKEFTVILSNAQKQITAANTNPGQPGYVHQGLDNNKISMCQDTPYTYTIKSAGTGDIFKANLVVRKKPGLTIRKVQVEYDGVVYDTIVSNPKHIGIERNGDVTTYKLEDILPGGKLPGSLNEANPNKQQLKLTFSVLPTCNFNIGSSFDIDIVGENFCGGAATGQKTEEMIAGIIGANSDYTTTNSLTYLSGNANICAGLGGTGARYHGLTQINITGSGKRTGATGRLYIRVPKGFKYRTGSFTPTYTPPSYTEVNPGLPPTTTSYPVLPPTVLSYNTIGDETEVEIQIPQNLKNGHYFEYELEVYQDMNIPAQDCDQAAKLKYYTTDKITNLACPLLPSPSICHDVTIITGAEQKVDIHTERAELAITQVKTTSEIVAGQEKVTFKYKVKNNSTTTPHNTILKVALYKDANNDGVLEDSELVDTLTDGAALVTGGEQEFTHDKLLPHTDICRLYLVIRNKDNNCLCNDVKVAVPSPETITGLMDDQNGCESNPYTFALKPGVPTYDSYTWEAVSPADGLSYLSATNTATPVFTYNGTKLTTDTEFKYKLKVNYPNGGCESAQEVKLTVKPAPSITTQPTAPANPYCTGTTATPLSVVADAHGVAGTLSYEWYESITNAYNGTLKGSGPTFIPPTNAADTKYYYVKVKNTGCGETLSNIIMVKTNATPAQPTVVQDQAAGCGTVSTAKVTNLSSYATGISFKVTKGGTLVSATVASNGSINGISEADTYVIKAVKDGCESASTSFTIDAKKPIPVTPVVSQVSAAGCGTLSTAKVSNYATYPSGTTFTITTAADALVVGASVAADGTINGITTAGTYKVKAKQGTCDSSPVTFTIDAALAVPMTPVVSQVAAGCGTLSTAKVSNYATYPTGTTFTITTATDAAVAGASVLGDGTISGITSAGAYKVKAKIGTCTSEANFTIDAALAVPAAPTVTLTPASCTSLTVAKISNYVAGQTYWNGTTQLSVNATTHEITGLGVGTYTITTKEAGCESVASSSFEIKAKQAATTTTNPVGATYVKDAIAAPLTVTATGEGVLSYQWFEATSPTATGTAVGSNSPSYTPSTSTVGSKFYYVEVTGSCGTIKSAVAEIKVSSVIDAVDDPEVSVPRTGGTVSILTNDTLNGNPATPSNVTVTIDNDGGLTGLTVDSTGKLVVPNNTTPGTYTITYKICDKANLNVCDTATAKIKVPSVIDAVDDPEVSVPRTGGIVSILTNDTLNGNPATPSNVTVTIDNDGGLTGLTVDSTGKLVVPNNTTPGTYTITYKICDKANLNVCDTATAKIKVPSVIDAVDDPEVSVPRTGGIVSILTNDTLNGNPATPSNVTVTIDNDGGLTGLTVDSTGKLVVPNNTTPGTYTITYKICDRLDANVCDTATAKITVTGTPTTIQANDDGVWEVGTQGEFLTPSILDNDRIGSKIGLSASDVTIEKAQGQPAPDSHLVMNADGRITVKEGIALGTYIYYYTIIDKSNNNQTSSAKATIKVVSFVAQQDEYSMINTKDREQKTPSVITNDEMDGKKPPVIGTDVTLTPGTPSHPNLHMNPDGTITIAPNTPDGVYTYDYTICRVSNPTDCKTTQAIINLHPSLVANDDDYTTHPVNVIHQSAVVGNVLDNDTLGGTPITDPTKVTITLIDNDGLSGVSFASNGEVTVPQGAPAGTYRVRYNLCMSQQTSVCDDAVVIIVVAKEDPIEIYNGVSTNGDGKNDGFRIEGIENYRKNTLKIFNRWGVLVYQKEGYTNADPFTGYSNGRSTIESGKKLPQGTYYYILDYQDSNNRTQTKSGWLYLKKE